MAEAQALKLELVRSPIGGTERQRATVIALGLRKMHQVVEHSDSPVTRGMVHEGRATWCASSRSRD